MPLTKIISDQDDKSICFSDDGGLRVEIPKTCASLDSNNSRSPPGPDLFGDESSIIEIDDIEKINMTTMSGEESDISQTFIAATTAYLAKMCIAKILI